MQLFGKKTDSFGIEISQSESPPLVWRIHPESDEKENLYPVKCFNLINRGIESCLPRPVKCGAYLTGVGRDYRSGAK